MKLDLVMWYKNGGYCLDVVMRRIDDVIPAEVVHKEILVDDRSTDNTREVAKSYNWEVVQNRGRGIGDGANTALSHVDCEYFVSFEHDLVLAKDWFDLIPPQLTQDAKVAAVQGIRLPDHRLLRKLQEYKIERILQDGRKSHSMDNTIYRTNIIRGLGGYPRLPGAGVDSILVQKVLNSGYRWITDFDAVSVHLRKGVKEEIRHYFGYGVASPHVSHHDPSINLRRMIYTFGFSPVRGIDVALKKRDWRLALLYPLVRGVALLGYAKTLKDGGVNDG